MRRSTPTSASTARSAWSVSTPAAAYASLIASARAGCRRLRRSSNDALSSAGVFPAAPAPPHPRPRGPAGGGCPGPPPPPRARGGGEPVGGVRGERAAALDGADQPHRDERRPERRAD